MRPAGTTLALAFAFVVASAPGLRAQDLSVYRQFHIGMTATAATAQIGVPETAAIEQAEAPGREAAAKKSRDDIDAATHAKARLLNKAAFKF